jgi:membrane protease YdiL (CAAX protease family)
MERLFGSGFGVAGAVAGAVSAGVGEEIIWRGLVQPRYGLPAAALGFTALHAFQYGPDGLVAVLVAGVALGLVRHWANTTVAAVVHAGYDLWLLLAVVVGWP